MSVNYPLGFDLCYPLALEPAPIPVTLAGWSILFDLAWISHAGGQSLITFALAFLPATFSSLTLLLQPVVAAILAWLILGEVLGPMQNAGGVIIIVGIWLARRDEIARRISRLARLFGQTHRTLRSF